MDFPINKEISGKTVLFFLKQHLCLSRAIITGLKKRDDGILLNGRHVTVRAVLSEGDVLSLSLDDSEDEMNENLVPTDLPLNIIYEDDEIIALNKPGNMPTHPSHNHYTDTLANALAFYYAGKGVPFVFRAVGRLDRDTSGIVLVAKTKRASYHLSEQIAAGKIKKEYISVLCGIIEEDSKMTIDAPIARKAESIIERVVREDGQKAVTEFEVIARGNGMTAVKASPLTGRTHQLRVHFAYIGHPMVGDTLYGDAAGSPLIQRQALHCHSLTFDHPVTGETMTLTAEIPDEIGKLIEITDNHEKI